MCYAFIIIMIIITVIFCVYCVYDFIVREINRKKYTVMHPDALGSSEMMMLLLQLRITMTLIDSHAACEITCICIAGGGLVRPYRRGG